MMSLEAYIFNSLEIVVVFLCIMFSVHVLSFAYETQKTGILLPYRNTHSEGENLTLETKNGWFTLIQPLTIGYRCPCYYVLNASFTQSGNFLF